MATSFLVELTPTHLCRVSLALEGAAEIVDNDTGTTGAKEGGISLAETAASSSDDDDLAVVSQLITHDCEDVCVWRRKADNCYSAQGNKETRKKRFACMEEKRE